MSLFSIEVKNIENEISKKMSNSLLFTFFVAELVFHWQFFVGLLTSETFIYENFHITKIEYLYNILFTYGPWWLHTITWIGPFIATWLFIWILPKKIFIPAFIQSEEYEIGKLAVKLNLEKKVSTLEADVKQEEARKTEAEVKIITAEQEIAEVKNEATTQWDKELTEFKRPGNHIKYKKFVGQFYSNSGAQYTYSFNSDEISTFDAFGLVEIDGGKVIRLTEKGKYFLKKINS